MTYRWGAGAIRTALVVLACGGFCAAANAADKVTVEAVDPGKPLAEIMKNNPNNCHIIYQDGKPYRVCPFRVPLEIQGLIKEQAK